ncbi:MAG: hypothetical protein ACXV8Q_08840 [Methylobacter sp.]
MTSTKRIDLDKFYVSALIAFVAISIICVNSDAVFPEAELTILIIRFLLSWRVRHYYRNAWTTSSIAMDIEDSYQRGDLN